MVRGVFDYRLKVEEETFGSLRLQVESLANLNETIDHLFERLETEGRPELLETLCPYFGVVWPSARGLSEFLAEVPRTEIEGKRVLEVGCGLAVPSLVAASLGARVTATDFHPDIRMFLERNLVLNQVTGVEYKELDWQSKDSPLGEFDWVIGSDILYEKQHPAPVARTLAARCASGGRIVLVDPGRPYLQGFADEMRALGFGCEVRTRTVRDTPVSKDVFILELKRT